MIIQEPIQAAIWHSLNHYAYSDAIFLSERLHTEVKSDESLYLLATSYYRSGLKNHAYYVLKNNPSASPNCRYLFARCALDLNQFDEAESALVGGDNRLRNLDEVVADFGNEASFALQLMAQICVKTERGGRAADAFRKALKLNPFLWSCFTDLCNRGERPDVARTFQLSEVDNLAMCHGGAGGECEPVVPAAPVAPAVPAPHHHHHTPAGCVLQSSVNRKLCTPDDSPQPNAALLAGAGPVPPTKARPVRYRSIFGAGNALSPLTPSFGVLQFEADSPDTYFGTPSIVPQSTLAEANDQKSLAKRVRAHVGQLINRKDAPLQHANAGTPAALGSLGSLGTQNVRRSSRLFSNSYSVKENNKSPNRGKFATPKSPSRKPNKRFAKAALGARGRDKEQRPETVTSPDAVTTMNAHNSLSNQQHGALLQRQSAEGLMQLLRTLGQAYLHLAHFECRRAVELLGGVSPRHYHTAWVQSMLAVAHFEMADYEASVTHFREVHRREPYRLQHMEMYSTALWHLQREVALSALAQDLVKQDRGSPVTWCVAGNCFSLHKEHDTAIRFFQRAVQIDPAFPYAYTLLGHEYILTEELDKAMSSFRNAIRLDARHYNAWFGIGTIYSKQERYHLAEINYLRALSINTHSSVIMCHIGVVQHALKKADRALQTLNRAIASDPRNPLCKFHRGQIFFNLGRHADALRELEELKEIVPKESLVYYLIGKVHKKLGNTELALMHFSWATDLDPKGANSQIKEAFDPSVSRAHTDTDSPQSPSPDDFPSESNSAPPPDTSQDELVFSVLPEDSDESL